MGKAASGALVSCHKTPMHLRCPALMLLCVSPFTSGPVPWCMSQHKVAEHRVDLRRSHCLL